jgi:hemerythrin-like domain-containing protein/mannose-6-phosphate isomerase-like protein (cupin superfamily)
MRRHPALRPLSHHHHRALVAARRARRAADGAPAERIEAARAFLVFFDSHAVGHFREEEEHAFPLLLEGEGEVPDELAAALLDHARLRALARRLRASLTHDEVPADLLAEVGALLDRHVRLEERVLFPMIEERAAEQLEEGLPTGRGPAPTGAGPGGTVVDLALPARGRGPQWGMQSLELNATLLAWPAGAGVGAHRNDERDVLLIVLEGTAELTLDGQHHALSDHELVLLPRGSERAFVAGASGARMLSVHLRREPMHPRSRVR